jgi:hypothetical protein
MADYYKDSAEIEAVVKGFESCTTGKDDFNHCSHLTVAVFYLHELGKVEAAEKMRTGLLRFLEHIGCGREKYNETLTLFWLRVIHHALEQLDQDQSLLEKTNFAIESLVQSRLVLDYYSAERLWSDEAKRTWLEPDLKPLPIPQHNN